MKFYLLILTKSELIQILKSLLIFSDDDLLLLRHIRHRSRFRVQPTICVLSLFLQLGGLQQILLFEDISWHLAMLSDSLDLRMCAVLLLEGFVVSERVLLSRLQLKNKIQIECLLITSKNVDPTGPSFSDA